MDTVKQLFDIFINRTLAYGYSHHIGLITFNEAIAYPKAINEVTRDFRQEISALQPTGWTALWDALHRAKVELDSYGSTYPDAIKRIIVLTDGEDTGSTRTPSNLYLDLQVRSFYL
jgi:Mg-chelatase subunit ChlD